MRNRNGLFWGITLVTLGVLFLGRNLNWFNLDWSYVRDLWPLLLILAGANLILVRRGSQAAPATTILLALALPIALFSFVDRHHNRDRYNYSFRENFDNDDNSDQDSDNDNGDSDSGDESDTDDSDNERGSDNNTSVETRSNTFVETLNDNTREATLNLSGGAARFVVGEPAAAADLIKADTKMTQGSYTMSVDRNPTTGNALIDLKPTEGKTKLNLNDGEVNNRVTVLLNEKPVWTVKVGMGAGQGDFDLSRLDVKKVDVGVGAADLDLKLGSRATQSDIKISAGVASVTLHVPKDVGCRITTDGAMNLSQLDDFTKLNDDLYETSDYAAAAKKIVVTFNGGMSKFNVIRY